ncbi:SRPBCC family protein [Streptomyces sp. NPDC058371]|uniref:SRPBCC family protein n=1 Tax=Streptomyces sp. NPDC058371 TaxID=3346463 RepID=UPI00365A5597
MSTTTEEIDVFATSWKLTASVAVDAPADQVYGMVSDITRMGEWSPECLGGKWTSGTPGQEGARFHGFNREGEAEWTSQSEVVTAVSPREFEFTVMAFCPGQPDENTQWVTGSQPGDMTWSFRVEENGSGCVLTQTHTMKLVGPFYRLLLEGVEESERSENVQNRKEHLQHSMESTLAKLKSVAEQGN